MTNDLMTRKEVSEFLRMSPRTIDYLIASKQLPYYRVGKRSVRFSKQKLEEYLRKNENREYTTSRN